MNVNLGSMVPRNAAAFVAMLALYGGAIKLTNYVLESLHVTGIQNLLVPFAVDALCGSLGYFAFTGNGALKTWLVFFSVIAFGALMVWLYDPTKTFFPLLTSLPFAAVAALATRITGNYFEKNQDKAGA